MRDLPSRFPEGLHFETSNTSSWLRLSPIPQRGLVEASPMIRLPVLHRYSIICWFCRNLASRPSIKVPSSCTSHSWVWSCLRADRTYLAWTGSVAWEAFKMRCCLPERLARRTARNCSMEWNRSPLTEKLAGWWLENIAYFVKKARAVCDLGAARVEGRKSKGKSSN